MSLILLAAVLSAAACADGSDDAAVAQCLDAEMHASDKVINEVYKEALAKKDKAGKSDLKAAQRGWLKARDQACKLDDKLTDREAWIRYVLADRQRTLCVVRFTRAREAELRGAAPVKADELSNADNYTAYSKTPRGKGKWYFEVKFDFPALRQVGYNTIGFGFLCGEMFYSQYVNIRPGTVAKPGAPETFGVGIDLDQGKAYQSRDGVWLAEPGSNKGVDVKLGRECVAVFESTLPLTRVQGGVDLNFGKRPFRYALPAGYLAAE